MSRRYKPRPLPPLGPPRDLYRRMHATMVELAVRAGGRSSLRLLGLRRLCVPKTLFELMP
jgi:hypothetical protein